MTGDLLLDVEVERYRLQMHKDGRLEALRDGKPWDRNLNGDGLVLSLAMEVQDLRSDMKQALASLKECRRNLENYHGWLLYESEESSVYNNQKLNNLIEELDEKNY